MLILKCKGMKHLLSWQALRTFIFEWEGWEIDLEAKEDKDPGDTHLAQSPDTGKKLLR